MIHKNFFGFFPLCYTLSAKGDQTMARKIAFLAGMLALTFSAGARAKAPAPPLPPQPAAPAPQSQPTAPAAQVVESGAQAYPTQCPAEGQKISVAIYPIKPAGADASLAQAMTALLSSQLTPSPKLKVIEEAMLKAVMERQALNVSDACDDTSCQVEIGKLVKAQKMIAGDMVKFGNKFVLSLKLIDIQTGTTEFSTEDKCSCTEDQLDQLVGVSAAKVRNHFCEQLPVPDSAVGPSAPPVAQTQTFAPNQAFGPVPAGKARIYVYWKENAISGQSAVAIPVDRKQKPAWVVGQQQCVAIEVDAGPHFLGFRANEGIDFTAASGGSYYAEMNTWGKALIHWGFTLVPEAGAAAWLPGCRLVGEEAQRSLKIK